MVTDDSVRPIRQILTVDDYDVVVLLLVYYPYADYILSCAVIPIGIYPNGYSWRLFPID